MERKVSRGRRILLAVIIFIVIILFDQFTKYLAVTHLAGKPDVLLIPGVLQLEYLENTGAAFSLLSGRQILFAILTPIFMIVICYFMHRMPVSRRFSPLYYDLVFLLAGAFGNYIDRIRQQYVVDFIYFSLIDFPIFNVADICVTLSIVVLILLILFHYKEDDFSRMSGKAGK